MTSRPFYRPPYGNHNAAVDRVAAQLGYTDVLMWSGTLGDTVVQTPQFILNQMQMYAKPGLIVLAHGNHPATAAEIDQVIAVATDTGLRLVTVAEILTPPPPTTTTSQLG